MSRGKSGTHRHTLGQKERTKQKQKEKDITCRGGRKKKKEKENKIGQVFFFIILLSMNG